MQKQQNGHIRTKFVTKKPHQTNSNHPTNNKVLETQNSTGKKPDKTPLAKVVLKRTFSNYCFSLNVSPSCTSICWMHCLLSANLSLSILRMPEGQESTFAVVGFHCLFYSLDLLFFPTNLYVFSFS